MTKKGEPFVVILGWPGLLLILFCTLCAAYSGSRIGLTWEILSEDHPELKGFLRDPYPVLAEMAGLVNGKTTSIVMRRISIGSTLYCMFCAYINVIILILCSTTLLNTYICSFFLFLQYHGQIMVVPFDWQVASS